MTEDEMKAMDELCERDAAGLTGCAQVSEREFLAAARSYIPRVNAALRELQTKYRESLGAVVDEQFKRGQEIRDRQAAEARCEKLEAVVKAATAVAEKAKERALVWENKKLIERDPTTREYYCGAQNEAHLLASEFCDALDQAEVRL